MPRHIDRAEFDKAVEAVWTEIEYQNSLSRRTDKEALDTPGFLSLGDRYLRKAQDEWADNEGDAAGPHNLRKLAAIFVRGMLYVGIVKR